MTAAEFRAAYPEFSSTVKYPDGAVSGWLDTAEKTVSPDRWGELRARAVGLCAAHYLTMSGDNQDDPGSGGGVVASEKVGALSVSYDSIGYEERAGHWNATSYGRVYYRLARMVGACGVVA